MPVFNYSARDLQGQLISETIAFNNEVALREHLRKNNLYVIRLQQQQRSGLLPRMQRRVGLADLIIVARQLRTMINAGMPLVTGLEALAEQAANPALEAILQQVSRSVGHGNSLAGTLEQYPTVFPSIMVSLVRAGEEGGRLPEALQEASRQLELQMEMRQKLISALVYPIFTLVATVGTVAVMLLYIVPIFAKIYEDLHATLPPMTLSLVWTSNFLIHQGWIFVLAVIAGAVALRQYNRTPEGRLRIDGFKLRVPIFGTLFLKSASGNLTGSLAGLVDSGVPLIQALQTASTVCGNEVLATAARDAAQQVISGKRLSDELERSGHFPVMVVRMLAISEEVGTLPMVLREIAASYAEEVEYAIRRIMGLIEPVMIVMVAFVVGYVLLALYYPIFMLGNVFLKSG